MKNTQLTLLLSVALLSANAGVTIAQVTVPEAKAIEVIKSDASYKDKSDACRSLAKNGTKEAVPALAAMLGDEKLNHPARIALEQIPDPSVNAALLDALGKLQGLQLAGVISSLGNLHDVKAIAPISKLLAEGDTDVKDAAAYALGRIGTPASAKPLLAALANPTPSIYDGLLRCAETLPHNEAAVIYDAVLKPPTPQPLRMAALRGALLARQEKSLPLLLESLRGNDDALVLEAMQTARLLPGAAITKGLAAELQTDKLSADRQLLLVQALGDRRDTAAGPQLLATANKSEGPLRAAAVKAMMQVGDASAIPLFTELLPSPDDEVAKAARAGLAGFKGREVEAPIVGLLKSTDPKVRVIATELIVQRGMRQAIPQLLLGANDADPTVATASLRAIGDIGGNPEGPALIKMLTSGASMQATENALSAIYTRNRDVAAADALSAALPTAPTAAKIAMFRLLRRIGGPKALAEIRTATKDTSAEVREGAMRNLADWPTVDALPDLMALATTPPTPAIKVLALRGLFRLIPQQDGSPNQLASVKAGLGLVERPEERRLALAVLGGIPTAESLALVLPELANPALKEEACLAAVTIGEKLVKTQPAPVGEAMAQVIQTTKDQQVTKRAQALMPK